MSLRDKLHILVVDDMSTSRGLILQSLEDLGIFNTDYCRDGNEAFQKIVSKPVHLVVSDYNMPNMNGLELLRSLRQNPATQQTGFILVSGSPTQDILDSGRKLGMNNFIKKPFSTADMKQCIESVVGAL